MARSSFQRDRDSSVVEDLLIRSGAVPRGSEIKHTKVVGVMHSNEDGTSRQEAIGGMAQFDPVELVRNPHDEYDANAIQVFAEVDLDARRRCRESTAEKSRVQIGHLPAEVAEELAPRIDAGEQWKAIASRVSFHISRGVSLMLFRVQ